MENIINFDVLEKPIKEIEEVFARYNELETDLILRELAGRRTKQKQKQAANDAIQNISITDLMKQVTGAGKDE